MQLYAFGKNETVFVDDAKKGVSYICCDCHQEVRVRGGRYNIRHFFHVKPKKKCEYQRRSLTHIAIQYAILQSFPKGEIILEKRVANGSRRADAIWEREKIVFEVQCSPISLMEVQRRENEYASFGYKIVWILSDRRFNKRYVSPAERELRMKTAYYANHSDSLKGWFYDQFEIIFHQKRVKKFAPLPINIARKYPQQISNEKLPKILKDRVKPDAITFSGDLYERALKYQNFRLFLIKVEKEHMKGERFSIKKKLKQERREMYTFLLKQSFL